MADNGIEKAGAYRGMPGEAEATRRDPDVQEFLEEIEKAEAKKRKYEYELREKIKEAAKVFGKVPDDHTRDLALDKSGNIKPGFMLLNPAASASYTLQHEHMPGIEDAARKARIMREAISMGKDLDIYKRYPWILDTE